MANHQINFGANYLYKEQLNINIRMNLVGKRITGENTTVPSNTEEFNSYAVFNGAVSYTPKNKEFTIQLTVFNLLDKHYFSPGLDLATGSLSSLLIQNKRNIHFSLQYEF